MRKSIYSRSCDHHTSQARHQLKALQAGSPVVMEMHIPGLMCQVKPNSARPADEIGDHRMGFEYFAMCLNVCMSVWFLLGVQSDQKVKKYQLTVEATSWDTFFFLFSMSATHFFRGLNTSCCFLSLSQFIFSPRFSRRLDLNVLFSCVSSVLHGEHQTSQPGSVPSIHQQHAVFMWWRLPWRCEVPEEGGVDELTVRLPHGKNS